MTRAAAALFTVESFRGYTTAHPSAFRSSAETALGLRPEQARCLGEGARALHFEGEPVNVAGPLSSIELQGGPPVSTQTDAATGVHPGPISGSAAGGGLATWSPHRERPGDPFDALHARLLPEIQRIIAQYEQKRSGLIPLAHLFQKAWCQVIPMEKR